MRLKHLELQGYKSFANRTEFLFDEQITAIVGPNGSGKSNIADGLRWVLGEQSYTALRAKRTEDMIFAGSDGRPRQGMAEVTLTLDNTDGALPIAFTEVTLTRRAYRSGENEYFINGARVRLRQVLDLLGAAGLSRSPYLVIGQGLVDAALALRPDQRRELIDEAAGIRPYQLKRDNALSRLAETQANMVRANDILNELSPRLRRLEQHAERAYEHARLSQELKDLLVTWYGYQWHRAQEQLRQAKARRQSIAQLMARHETELRELNQRIVECRGERESQRGHLAGLRREEARLRGQYEEVRRNLAVRQERARLLADQQGELEQEVEALRAQVKATRAEIAEMEAGLRWLEEESARQTARLEERRAAIQGLEARRVSLQQSLPITEEVIRKHKGRRLADLIQVPPELESAVEAALGDWLWSVIVETRDQAVEALKDLWAAGGGRATFLPLDALRPPALWTEDPIRLHRDQPGILGRLCELIHCDDRFRPAVESLLGTTWLVADLDLALQLWERNPGIRFVTRRGEVLEPTGMVTGGDASARGKRRTPYQARGQRAGASGDAPARDPLEKAAKGAEERAGASELNQLGAGSWETRGLAAEAAAALTSPLEAARAGLAGRQRDLSQLRERLNARVQRLEALAVELRDLRAEIQGLEAEQQRLGGELAALEGQIQPAEAALDEMRERERRLEQEVSQVRERRRQAEASEVEVTAEVSRWEERATHLQAEIAADLELLAVREDRLQLALDLPGDLSPLPAVTVIPEGLERQVHDLKRRLRALGPVDPETLAEYESTRERYNFLSEQIADLHKAAEDLGQVIAELDQIMAERFNETFTAVSEAFSRYFTALFGGGTARLVRVESEGILTERSVSAEGDRPGKPENVGVDIVARPPGKRPQPLALLSGGERALTAVALIFALLEVSKTPFCFLDEVDAMLDEANIERFRQALQSLAQRVQFIVITHNRGTIEAAHSIYGVSMSEEGVSQVISLKLDETAR